MNVQNRLARIAGSYYLLVAIFGGFAHLARGRVYVPGDAVATYDAVRDHVDLVRLSFAADLVQAVFMLLTMLALRRLMGTADNVSARAMSAFVITFIAIISLNQVHQYAALAVATDPAYAMLTADGPAPMALLLMELQHAGYLVAQIFFGLWLWPLGTLILRSGLLPRFTAYSLRAACVAYVIDVAAQFLAPAALPTPPRSP